MIPQSFIQDLLNRVDIVDVVGRYVQLKKGGANFMGLCPFHNEKSPSFTVSPTKQFYHCFGCGAHGTAVGFLMEFSGMGFVEAVKDLAQGVGMTVPEQEDRIPPAQRAEMQSKSLALSEAMTQACNFYRQQLRGARPAIDYLKGRGLTGEVAARFGVGYAPDSWDSLRGVFPDYEAEALVEAGLVIDKSGEEGAGRKRYDRFRDRIMFPIRNTKGQVIGFGGRVMGAGEPKYLNSPETPLFQKGSELYGLFEARQAIRDKGYVLVTEGYMDVVALAQFGFEQAVATLGTACTPVHVQKLLRQTDNVIFSFDGDAAGRRAARRALEACLPHATDNRALKFLFLPAEHDPDSYIREFGNDAFEKKVHDATPLSQFLIATVTDEKDLATAEGRARAQFDAKPLIQAMPASALRLQLLRQLAQITDSTAQELEALFELARLAPAGKFLKSAPPAIRRKPPVELERKVLRLLLAHPALAADLDDEALQMVGQSAPDHGAMLRSVAAAARGVAGDAGFAVLAEMLRGEGGELDRLVAEVAAEPPSEFELARRELAGAVRQTTMKILRAEQDRLAAAGLPDEAAKTRYREIAATLDRLRAAADRDAAT
ncbi:MAG: DNA primase [Burkholderiaceae bacterium]|nr:DNA primase [Burkholderiaceae bacterium]